MGKSNFRSFSTLSFLYKSSVSNIQFIWKCYFQTSNPWSSPINTHADLKASNRSQPYQWYRKINIDFSCSLAIEIVGFIWNTRYAEKPPVRRTHWSLSTSRMERGSNPVDCKDGWHFCWPTSASAAALQAIARVSPPTQNRFWKGTEGYQDKGTW